MDDKFVWKKFWHSYFELGIPYYSALMWIPSMTVLCLFEVPSFRPIFILIAILITVVSLFIGFFAGYFITILHENRHTSFINEYFYYRDGIIRASEEIKHEYLSSTEDLTAIDHCDRMRREIEIIVEIEKRHKQLLRYRENVIKLEGPFSIYIDNNKHPDVYWAPYKYNNEFIKRLYSSDKDK